MEACLIIGGVLLVLGVVAILLALVKALPQAPPPESAPRPAPHRFEFCPACDTPVRPTSYTCPSCRLKLDGRLAARLERVRVARDEIGLLRHEGQLDAETVDRVTRQLARRKHELIPPEHRPGRPTVPPPLPPERRKPKARGVARDPLVGERPPGLPHVEPAPITPVVPAAPARRPLPPPTPPPAEPRRSLAEVFGQFMHERNILWGELAGGLLIVGCSIALVLSLWRTLEELPYFTFLLFAGITAAVFGAGQYTLHHWKLTATSRGLLVIALLLAPLNLLLLADPGARGTTDVIDALVKVAAVGAFAVLVRTGGRDLAGTDALPGAVPRRWLLALAVVGAPATQMLPPVAAGPLRHLPLWLPLACFGLAAGAAVGRLSRDQRRPAAGPLGERAATAVLVFVGLGLFALFVAWGFFLARADDLAGALRGLALPAVVSGLPVLSAGLLVQRRLSEPAGLRATGTGAVVAGMMILFASLVLAWPDPTTLLAATAAVAVILGWVASRDEIPWAYAGAVPCAALAVVLGYHGLAAGWMVPEGMDPARWLAERLTAAASGAVLVGFGLVLGIASELWFRRGRTADAAGYALGAAGVVAAGLLLVTGHGIDRPILAAWAHVAAAAGFIAASFRWRVLAVAQLGVWLLLPASLWALWGTLPHDKAAWGLAIALKSLALTLLAVGLGRVRGVDRLRDACRDVAGAAAVLAPFLALMAPDFPRGAIHSGSLFALTASVFVLAWLYRQPALTWVGSLIGLVALAHLTTFTVPWEPWYGAVLLAILAHATLAMTAAFFLPSPPEAGGEGRKIGRPRYHGRPSTPTPSACPAG